MIVSLFFKYYTKTVLNKQALFLKEEGEIMSKFVDANKKIEEKVVGGYKKVEETVVGGYKKIEDKFVDTFLKHDDETIDEAKERLQNEQQEREKAQRKKI